MNLRIGARRVGRIVWPIAAAVLTVLLLWKLPQWQTAPSRAFLTPTDVLLVENAQRQTLVLLLGAAAIVVALMLVRRRIAATEETARESLAFAQDTQLLERYARTVELLGDERVEVRLGALYALERIAADAPAQRAPVAEVLCAYLRNRAAFEAERQAEPLPVDVQAVLTVLGRSPVAGGAVRLDLRAVDLRGADLDGAELAHAILIDAHLEGASLQRAILTGADLRGAHLSHADLVEANLKGADLREAYLEAAYLVEAHLEGANLGGAHMAGVYLGGAHLQGADLGGAQLDGAYLYKAELEGASLHGARMMSAIGVQRDERERVNRTAVAVEAAIPPRPPQPLRKPVSLKSDGTEIEERRPQPPPRKVANERRQRGAR